MAKTMTGLHVRKTIAVRIREAIRGLMGRRVQDWQPTQPCVCCKEMIEQRAVFCPICGVFQQRVNIIAPQQHKTVVLPQTEEIRRLPSPTRQTEELTSQMYAVRIGELRPIHQYLQEQKRKAVQQEQKKAEEALRDEARRRAI